MRLSIISEHGGLIGAPSQAVERLEELVDHRKGHLSPDDVKWIIKFLGRLQPGMIKRVAALLGTAATKPAQIANQIAAGELISYVDPDQMKNQTGTVDLTDDDDDFELSNYWTDDERAAMQAAAPQGPARPAGPTDADLQNIENAGAGGGGGGGGGDYVNSPPAIKSQPGGTPDLNTLHPNVKAKLEALSASSLIDRKHSLKCQEPQPFIYSGVSNRLYIGPANGYHYHIFEDVTPDKEAELRNLYLGGTEDEADGYKLDKSKALPGTVGRITYGLPTIDPSLAKTHVVGIYPKEGSNKQGMLRTTIQALLSGGYIPPDALVIYSERLMLANELAGGGPAGDVQASEDQKTAADLNARYYVGNFTQEMAKKFYDEGYWPDRKPISPQERSFLAKKFKLGGGGGGKGRWQGAMEKAGLVNPGQRWWAPTSEARSPRNRYAGNRIANIGG